MRKMFRVVAGFLAITSLIAFCAFPQLRDVLKAKAEREIAPADKITENLQHIMDESPEDESIVVFLWTEAIDLQAVEAEVYHQIGMNRYTIDKEGSEKLFTLEEVDAYIHAERSIYSEMQAESHAAFIEAHRFISAFEPENVGMIFCSSYAPLMELKLTKAEIYLLAEDPDVRELDYSPVVAVGEESTATGYQTVHADYTRNTLNLKGTGIKIGMIDSGLPEVDSLYFSGNAPICETIPIDPSYHASRVAYLLIGKAIGGYDGGLVPNATLYAVQINDSEGNAIQHATFMYGIEELLGQNVYIINMSCRLRYDEGISSSYSSYEKWVDHIAINHHVHFVKSAGNYHYENYPSYYVSSPGMAYNTVVVGNLNDGGSSAYTDDVINIASCYAEAVSLENKPDLVAPGTNLYFPFTKPNSSTPYYGTGTSYSAPITTAIIAQLCQANPNLICKPEGIKAILSASVTHPIHAYTSDYYNAPSNYSKYGAGVIDAKASYKTIDNSRFYTGDILLNGYPTGGLYTEAISSGKVVRVALSWLMEESFGAGVGHESNFPTASSLAAMSLKVYAPNGSLVTSISSSTNNTLIVSFTTQQAGEYYIEFSRTSGGSANTYYGVAWHYE